MLTLGVAVAQSAPLQTHWLPLQTSPSAQFFPHPPQLCGSLDVSRQAPPQVVSPTLQPQKPEVQLMPAPQAFPQAPQLSRSLVRFTQVVPQRVWPVGQVQAPAAQVWPVVQTFRQAPQLLVSIARSAQAVPQRVRPAEQVQAPEAQVWPVVQTFPQAPQLAGSLAALTQAALQRIWAPGQAQEPAAQVVPVGQAFPHVPQLAESVDKVAQTEPHRVAPALQAQALPTQVALTPQAFPQAPQSALSLVRFTQTAPHFVKPAVQVQAPPLQVELAPHALPQAPQLAESVERLLQVDPHSVPPAEHAQAPATHDFPEGQAAPQAPQLLASVERSTQAPPQLVCGVEQPVGPASGRFSEVVPQPVPDTRSRKRASRRPRPVMETLDGTVMLASSTWGVRSPWTLGEAGLGTQIARVVALPQAGRAVHRVHRWMAPQRFRKRQISMPVPRPRASGRRGGRSICSPRRVRPARPRGSSAARAPPRACPRAAPYLENALEANASDFVFPGPDGKQLPEHTAMEKIFRRILTRAGLIVGWKHSCRSCAARQDPTIEQHRDGTLRPCPKSGAKKMWPSEIPRPMRFHDCRHTAITLLLQLGVAPQFVQRIARHANSRTTLETYGHLLIEDLRAPLEALGKATAASANSSARATSADLDRAEKTAARSNLGPTWVQEPKKAENRRPGPEAETLEDRAFEVGAEHQVRTGDLRLGKPSAGVIRACERCPNFANVRNHSGGRGGRGTRIAAVTSGHRRLGAYWGPANPPAGRGVRERGVSRRGGSSAVSGLLER